MTVLKNMKIRYTKSSLGYYLTAILHSMLALNHLSWLNFKSAVSIFFNIWAKLRDFLYQKIIIDNILTATNLFAIVTSFCQPKLSKDNVLNQTKFQNLINYPVGQFSKDISCKDTAKLILHPLLKGKNSWKIINYINSATGVISLIIKCAFRKNQKHFKAHYLFTKTAWMLAWKIQLDEFVFFMHNTSKYILAIWFVLAGFLSVAAERVISSIIIVPASILTAYIKKINKISAYTSLIANSNITLAIKDNGQSIISKLFLKNQILLFKSPQ